jgi:hypothetical protein
MALGFALLAVTIFHPTRLSGPFGRDFEAYYSAGAVWNAGGDPWSRDVWRIERTIAGVDTSHDEMLPFVGPAASLPLWSLLARMPFDVARFVWLTLLALSVVVLCVAAAALAHAQLTLNRAAGAVLLGALTGPAISDFTLGQVALLSAAAYALTLLALERRSAWTIATACVAALQPNLALPLAAHLTGRRAAALLAASGAAFLALTFLIGGGASGFIGYLRLLGEHGAGERFILIQYSLPAILTSFHIAPTTATQIGDGFALLTLAVAAWFAVRWRARPRNVAALAIALLPLAVPFFHEHDFVIELIPAIVLAASSDARVRLLAGIASVAILVDWLGVAQRPHLAPQTVCLALAVACAFAALPNRSLRAASPWPPLVTSLLLLSIAVPLALAFPAPVWPDTLGAFRAAPELSASAVWAAEQHLSGLDAPVWVWGLLRAIPVAGCALLAFAAYVAGAGSAPTTTRPARTETGTGVSDLP